MSLRDVVFIALGINVGVMAALFTIIPAFIYGFIKAVRSAKDD